MNVLNNDYLQVNLPYSSDWDSIKEINEGWSSDEKYHVVKNNKHYLIRLFDVKQLSQKQAEFNFIQECYKKIECSKPIECSQVSQKSEKGYMLLSYVKGDNLEDKLRGLTEEKQYELGVQAGKFLKKIHQIPVKASQTDRDILNALIEKKQHQLKRFIANNYQLKYQEEMISFVQNNINLLIEQSVANLHGDYHPNNIILTPTANISIIDFNRFELSDPYEEFLKIELFTVESSKAFSFGQLKGYFDNQIPEKFWFILKLYSFHSAMFSIVWAENFGKTEVDGMINRYYRIYDDFKDSNQPKWIEKFRKDLQK